MTIDNIKEEIQKAEDIVILTHENPDGDAVGSALAMYLTLKKLNKQVDVIIPECPNTFKFLPGAEEIKKEGKEEPYDLAISVDVTGVSRLNGFAKYFEDAKVRIQIDHHQSNEMFADYNFVNPASPACAQNLIFIIEQLGVEIDKEIGTCLLTGIITDTGGFKYEGVSAETFEFTSWLLAKGVNVSYVYKKVLQTKTRANYELTKLIMDRMEFFCDNKVTFTYMTQEDEKNVGAGQRPDERRVPRRHPGQARLQPRCPHQRRHCQGNRPRVRLHCRPRHRRRASGIRQNQRPPRVRPRPQPRRCHLALPEPEDDCQALCSRARQAL